TGTGDGGIRFWHAATLAEADRQIERDRHERQAAEAERMRRWAEALPHLDPLVALAPGDLYYRYRRGMAYAELGRWREAVADLQAWFDRGPSGGGDGADLSLAYRMAGDPAGFRRACTALLQRYGRAEHPGILNGIAWACARGPDALADLSIPVRLAARAVA